MMKAAQTLKITASASLLMTLACLLFIRYHFVDYVALPHSMRLRLFRLHSASGEQLADQDQVPPASDVTAVNCTALFAGDKNETQRAVEFQQSVASTGLLFPDRYYINATQNCGHFIAHRRYATKPVNEEEAEFPLAFSILMYKDVGQFERLLRAIYRPQNLYCVHVDRKSTAEVHAAVRGIISCFDNVFFPDVNFDVIWGTFTVLTPELECMRKLLQRGVKWKYFINLTGQEFPLKTNWQIVRILKAFNNSNNMEGSVKGRNMNRYEGRPAPRADVTVTKGAVHIIATRAYAEYVINDWRSIEFLRWVKLTDVPDETFFSSLNHSPQLAVPGSYRGKPETNADSYPFLGRFKNWGSWPCGGKTSNAICIFGVADLPLLQDRRELFANKFHADYMPLAYDCLEQLHYDRVRREIEVQQSIGNCDLTFNSTIYSTFDFVRNHI